MQMPLVVVLLWKLVLLFQDPFLRDIPEYAVPTEARSKTTLGLATIYGRPKDSNGGGSLLACAPDYRVQTMPEMNVCAHRTYRCGTILAVKNVRTKKTTLCRVMDRGPYGALLEDGTWVLKRHAEDPGVWRGIADLTPAVAAAIDHSGFEKVKTWVVYTPKKKMVVKSKKKKKPGHGHKPRPNV